MCFVCDWLLSLSMFSRFIHVVACISISFLFMLNNIPLCGYITFCLSIQPLMDIWVISIISVIMNKAAMNLHIQVFIFISLGYTLRSGIAGLEGNSRLLNLLRNCKTVFQRSYTILLIHSTSNV